MNTELWHKVKQHILEEPNRLSMHMEVMTNKVHGEIYDVLDGYNFSIDDSIPLKPPCGTAGCIAGWTVILGHPGEDIDNVRRMEIREEAARLLGIADDDMRNIYYTTKWDDDLREAFMTTDIQKRAEVAAEMMDRFEQRMLKPAV